MIKSNTRHLIPLLFTVFMDSLGFGLAFPIFTPMIVNNEGGMFGPEVSLAARGLFFGLLVSAFCVGQFFGGPILGSLSDRIGRKKVLVGTMWLAFVGYLLASMGVVFQSVWILGLARLAGGIAAGNFAVAQSAVADMSSKEDKTKNFGLVGMAYWTGFVIGPYIGGKLAPYGFVAPFMAACALCLSCALLLVFLLKESLVKLSSGKIRFLQGIFQIRKAFTIPNLRGIFLVMFIFCLGWGFFTEFSPIFLMRRVGFNVGQVANYYAWVGLWIAVCQGILTRFVSKWVLPQHLLRIGLVLLGAVLPAMLFMRGLVGLFWLVPCIAFAQALVFPAAATLVSNSAGSDVQGEMMGIHNSVQSAAIAIPPLFTGPFVALYPHLPITVGSGCMLVAFLIFLKIFSTKEVRANQDEQV